MPLDFPIATSQLAALRSGPLVVPDPAALFRVEGPGALSCLQGLLTSDLAAPGAGSLVYGAFLTAKGMIVVDPWVLREEERFTLVLPAVAREPTAQLLARVLPPRLARVTDLTGAWTAAWLLGAGALERFSRSTGSQLPAAGKLVPAGSPAQSLLAGGTSLTPFSALLTGPTADVAAMTGRFEQSGARRGSEVELAAARVLAGWPSLGREIDERTLPQEVRFDELGAVSYVKGCYTGQETVARVHFRGHVNRSLRGLVLREGTPPDARTLTLTGKEVGAIRTALVLEDRVVALGFVRREIEDGTTLQAGSREAEVTSLPLPLHLVGG